MMPGPMEVENVDVVTEMVAFPDFSEPLEKSRTAKLKKYREWDLCLNFLRGDQYLRWDRHERQWETLRPGGGPKGANKHVFNLILGPYRALGAGLETAYPAIAVVPATDGTEDILKAKSSEYAIRYFWGIEDMRHKLHKLVSWILLTGNCGLHVYYDPKTERVRPEVISPYDLFFEANVNDWEESQWVAIRRFSTTEELKRCYPDSAEAIGAKSSTASSGTNGAEDNDGNSPEDRVEWFEVYWMDGSNRKAAWGCNQYLWQGENEIPVLPVQLIKYTSVPRDLWGIGMVLPIIGPQMAYNKARSRVIDAVELMADPAWLVHQSANVNVSDLANRPGQRINWSGGIPPTQIKGAEFPQYVIDNINRLASEIMDLSGVHSSSLGKRAAGVTSGRAVMALAESDSSQLTMTQNDIYRAVKGMTEAVLMLMKKNYTTARFMRMFDTGGQVIAKQIQSTDFHDTPEVIIQPGSLFQAEVELREQSVWNLVQLGAIDAKTALAETQFRAYYQAEFKKMKQLNHARELLQAATLGFEIEVFNTDDIPTFIEVFAEFVQSPGYYKLEGDTQDYIRDVLIALSTATAGPAAYEQAKASSKVFPVQQAHPAAGGMGMEPPGDFDQQGGAERAADGVANAPRNEAIIGQKIGGGGGLG